MGKQINPKDEEDVNVEDLQIDEIDDIFSESEVINKDEEIQFSLDNDDKNIPEAPTENTGFIASVKQINEIINNVICEVSKTPALFQTTALKIEQNNTMLVSCGNEVVSRIVKTHYRDDIFKTINSGILTVDWLKLRYEVNKFFNLTDIVNVIYIPSENKIRIFKNSPKRIRNVIAEEYSSQFTIEEKDYVIKNKSVFVDEHKLDVIVKIDSIKLKDMISLVNGSSNEPVFPLILNKNNNLSLIIDENEEDFECEFTPDNFNNPYDEEIKSYFNNGFQEIVGNSTGKLTLKFNDNAPLLIQEKSRNFTIVSVIYPFEPEQ